VPITSSARTPGTAITFQPSSRNQLLIGSTRLRRSSGIGERWALYLGIQRTALGIEHAHRVVGLRTSLRSFCIMR
jgi:hypothetical protein